MNKLGWNCDIALNYHDLYDREPKFPLKVFVFATDKQIFLNSCTFFLYLEKKRVYFEKLISATRGWPAPDFDLGNFNK